MIFVAELTAAVGSEGILQTFYITTGNGFITKPSDSPANTNVYPRLLDPGTYSRALFSGSKVFGAVRPSFGSVVISNPDGLFDIWKTYGFDGQSFILRIGEEGGDYPSSFSTVFKCTMTSIKLTERDVTVNLSDRLSMLDKPVLNRPLLGTGGVEGTSDMAGEMLPRAFSDPGWIPLKLLDSSNLIYAVQAESTGGLGTSVQLYDGGVEVIKEADYSSVSDLLANPPSAGNCRIYHGGPTYIRIGTPPTYDLRVYTMGYKVSGPAYKYADLAIEAGVTDAVIEASLPVYGLYVDDASTTYMDVLDESCKVSLSYYGFDRLDVFRSGFVVPTPTSPVYSFNRNNCISISRTSPDFQEVPTYNLTISSGQTWPCRVAEGATTRMKDYLTRQNWFSTLSYQDDLMLDRHKLAKSDIIEMKYRIPNSHTFDNIRKSYMNMFGVERDQVMIECLLTEENYVALLSLDIMSSVEVKMPRFGFDEGKTFKIISMSYKLSSNRLEFILWG